MKKYVVTKSTPFSDDKMFYIISPNIEAIKKWITEMSGATVSSMYELNNGGWVTQCGDYTFTIKKWKEHDWITL